MARAYLDHNASAPVRPHVRDAMAEILTFEGNPSSVHEEGRGVRARVEKAREQVAALVGAEPRKVIFTSGGTESNVTALSWEHCTGSGEGDPVCFMASHEHPSVLAGGRFAPNQIRTVAVDTDGVIDLNDLETKIRSLVEGPESAPFMVSVMLANNETGALQPVSEAAKLVREHGGTLHCDAIQAAGKVPVDISTLGAHLISLSAHKIGGPQGVGALVLGEGLSSLPDPLITGGGQELRARSGTENVSGIIGFGSAASAALDGLTAFGELAALRDRIEAEILDKAPQAVIFSSNVARLPNTTNFAIPGMQSDTLVIALDLAGVAASAGSSCSSGKVERSHVLAAMDIDEKTAGGALRISLGWNSSDADADAFITAWSGLYEQFNQKSAAA